MRERYFRSGREILPLRERYFLREGDTSSERDTSPEMMRKIKNTMTLDDIDKTD